ncbi:MAG: hypothetical protein J6W67_03190, partial [Lentisphaeria bacterium]|nr:hypothetical protein [Lentisphaeria bacterium]
KLLFTRKEVFPFPKPHPFSRKAKFFVEHKTVPFGVFCRMRELDWIWFGFLFFYFFCSRCALVPFLVSLCGAKLGIEETTLL